MKTEVLNWAQAMHRWYVITLMVALHFGMDTAEDDTFQRHSGILDFIEQAVSERITAEQQQIADMDKQYQAQADYDAAMKVGPGLV